jgi:hypothetical protein
LTFLAPLARNGNNSKRIALQGLCGIGNKGAYDKFLILFLSFSYLEEGTFHILDRNFPKKDFFFFLDGRDSHRWGLKSRGVGPFWKTETLFLRVNLRLLLFAFLENAVSFWLLARPSPWPGAAKHWFEQGLDNNGEDPFSVLLVFFQRRPQMSRQGLTHPA